MEPRNRLVVLALALLSAAPLRAGVLLTQKQALDLAFPGGQKVERETAYLTADQVKQAENLGRVKVEQRVWTYYVGRSSAGVTGYAFFETHQVRTMPETFMAVLEPDGAVRSVEILSFMEPDDYKPMPRWLRQFQGKTAAEPPLLHRNLRGQTGASLTSQALSDGVRRVLAVHGIIMDAQKGKKR